MKKQKFLFVNIIAAAINYIYVTPSFAYFNHYSYHNGDSLNIPRSFVSQSKLKIYFLYFNGYLTFKKCLKIMFSGKQSKSGLKKFIITR